MTRAELTPGAAWAAALRDERAAATLVQLRAEAEGLPDGQYPRRRLMIGGGAALAGRDTDVLIVDGRGRWHVDPIEAIVQSADQVRHLHQTGIGDPHRFAGPRERVPLEAIRLWEDTIAASGPVVDGHARLVVVPDGRLLSEVRPADGSHPILIEVDGEPLVATGVPPEIVPGCSPKVPRVPEALRLLREYLDGAGTREAAAAHAALASPTSDAVAGWALTVLDQAGLIGGVRASTVDTARAALQTLEATHAWDQARASAPGRVLYGDEVGDGAYDPHLADDWLIGGIGGAAIANAESILRANPVATVSMVGTAAPWVLHNDAQYLALRRQHDAAFGGDGRLRTFGGLRLGPVETVSAGTGTGAGTGGVRFRAGGVEGDAYVACLGRVAQIPQALDPLRTWALDNGGTISGELVFDGQRQYLGYRLVFAAGRQRQDITVTGAASRILPQEVFRRDDMRRVDELGARRHHRKAATSRPASWQPRPRRSGWPPTGVDDGYLGRSSSNAVTPSE